jgi:hypothetical protein
MFFSHEVRWFLEGGIGQYPDLRKWVEAGARHPQWSGRMDGKPDVYIVVPGAADMGIKWREGQLQIKGRECALGRQVFAGGHEGNVERWIKWSYDGPAIEQRFGAWFSQPRIIEVFKTRCLRKLRINPFSHAQTEVDASAAIERGGCLEVTDLRVGKAAYCSVAFESFPNDSAMHGDFTAFVNGFLEKLQGSPLTASNSMGYPAWLQTLRD